MTENFSGARPAWKPLQLPAQVCLGLTSLRDWFVNGLLRPLFGGEDTCRVTDRLLKVCLFPHFQRLWFCVRPPVGEAHSLLTWSHIPRLLC